MNICGIIAEYNPFHNGHLYHINQTKAAGATHICVVLSSNFVQRGEPAIINKWQRTKSALLNGADLVIELPTFFSMSSAGNFAKGAVYLLNSLGCINSISFGCEDNNIESFNSIINILDANKFKTLFKEQLSLGQSFAAARQKALSLLALENSDIILKPNNILSLEYLYQLKLLNSSISPILIKRISAEHDSEVAKGSYASASYLRSLVKNNKINELIGFMPENSFDLIKSAIDSKIAPSDISFIERAILAKLRSMNLHDFKQIPDVNEGLEHKIFSSVKSSSSLNELYSNIKSKRYAHSRIRRICLNAFLGITKPIIPEYPQYIRVLGFTKKGCKILNLAKKTSSLPIITEFSQIKSLDKALLNSFELESQLSDIYALSLPKPMPSSLDYTTGIIKF